MRLLYGNYELTIDGKNRLLVPSEIRKALDADADGKAFFMVTGINGKLWLYPEKYYEMLASQIRSDITPEEGLLDFDQANISMATRLEWDGQGRILITDKILRKAGLGKAVTLLGVREHAEIWNRTDWEKRAEELDQRRTEIAIRAKQQQRTAQTQHGLPH